MNPIKEGLKRQRGIASYCTSNELVLEACMEEAGKEMGLSIKVQREDIFQAMHRI